MGSITGCYLLCLKKNLLRSIESCFVMSLLQQFAHDDESQVSNEKNTDGCLGYMSGIIHATQLCGDYTEQKCVQVKSYRIYP